MKDRKQLEIDGGLVLAMIGSGLLMIPTFGLLPLFAIGAAIGASYYIANNVHLK